MAAAFALADRHIVTTILHQLSDMKYKDRRQRGPDQPVELLEFRPTLIPSILVNTLWAEEGLSLLWKRYPHLPALRNMTPARRQYYANKVHQLFSIGLRPNSAESLDYLDGLQWPNLKSLELELDFSLCGAKFFSMLHSGLEMFEVSGPQGEGSSYFAEILLPTLFTSCHNLKGVRFGPGTFSGDDFVHASALFDHLASTPSITMVDVKHAGFGSINSLFARLSQRPGLETLEIDVEPGLALLPLLEGPNAVPSPFLTLKRLNIMCYPEIALSLLAHLPALEDFQVDVCRIPTQLAQNSDPSVVEDLVARLCLHPNVRRLRVGVGAMAIDFPSATVLPMLSGASLVALAKSCSRLEHVHIFAVEPSALNGSAISSEDFDAFCKALPHLQHLSLKFHPTTVRQLEETGLKSLGTHCPDLEVIRLRVPFKLPGLPVPGDVPQVLIHAPRTPTPQEPDRLGHAPSSEHDIISSPYFSFSNLSLSVDAASRPPSLFPKLTHLAIARPYNILALHDDSFMASSTSNSRIIDPELEESLVSSWAHPLLAHFPRLETLEAWGEWTGQDNESLNYFLPMEEILATTWEFLSGVEQDLWADEEDEYDSWQEGSSVDDWETASYLNEYVPMHDASSKHLSIEDELEGANTPGRTLNRDDYFEHDVREFNADDDQLQPQTEKNGLHSQTPTDSKTG